MVEFFLSINQSVTINKKVKEMTEASQCLGQSVTSYGPECSLKTYVFSWINPSILHQAIPPQHTNVQPLVNTLESVFFYVLLLQQYNRIKIPDVSCLSPVQDKLLILQSEIVPFSEKLCCAKKTTSYITELYLMNNLLTTLQTK